jgi:hypothetical protein
VKAEEHASLPQHRYCASVAPSAFVALNKKPVHSNGVYFHQLNDAAYVRRLIDRIGQINVCWSNFDNPVASLNGTLFNKTYSILSSANPSAASYIVPDLRQIAVPTTSSSPSSTSPSVSSAITTSFAISSATISVTSSPSTHTTGVSGGAIGGIICGVVCGLALLSIPGWLLWRRRRSRHHEVAQDEVPELSAEDKTYAHMKAGGDISELSSTSKPIELDQPTVELDATEHFPDEQRR